MRVRAHACSGGSCGRWHVLTRSASRTQVPSLARHAAEDTGLPRGGSRRLAARRQSLGPSARRTEAVIGSPRRLAAEAVIGSPRGSCGSARCKAAAPSLVLGLDSLGTSTVRPAEATLWLLPRRRRCSSPAAVFRLQSPSAWLLFCRAAATVAQQYFWPGGQGCHSTGPRLYLGNIV